MGTKTADDLVEIANYLDQCARYLRRLAERRDPADHSGSGWQAGLKFDFETKNGEFVACKMAFGVWSTDGKQELGKAIRVRGRQVALLVAGVLAAKERSHQEAATTNSLILTPAALAVFHQRWSGVRMGALREEVSRLNGIVEKLMMAWLVGVAKESTKRSRWQAAKEWLAGWAEDWINVDRRPADPTLDLLTANGDDWVEVHLGSKPEFTNFQDNLEELTANPPDPGEDATDLEKEALALSLKQYIGGLRTAASGASPDIGATVGLVELSCWGLVGRLVAHADNLAAAARWQALPKVSQDEKIHEWLSGDSSRPPKWIADSLGLLYSMAPPGSTTASLKAAYGQSLRRCNLTAWLDRWLDFADPVELLRSRVVVATTAQLAPTASGACPALGQPMTAAVVSAATVLGVRLSAAVPSPWVASSQLVLKATKWLAQDDGTATSFVTFIHSL
ncbi:MAG: hypothetical protein IT204_26070 [Fimbriimonadaceae bacterium]|nr:hypothetical protein [Fimbriimonadaceae bacterium]